VSIFFTFYGLNLLKKDVSDLKVSPLGNPGMPMKMPFGPEWFKGINWNIPNLVQAGVPGFENLATVLMQQTIKNNGVATIEELRGLSLEADVKFIACQMTVDLFGFSHDDFIPGLDSPARRPSCPWRRRPTSACSCSRNATRVPTNKRSVWTSPMTLVKLCNILKLIDSREASPCN
jgi:peroxiredoxin family protein